MSLLGGRSAFGSFHVAPAEVYAGISEMSFNDKIQELQTLGFIMKFFYLDGYITKITAPINIQGGLNLLRMRVDAITKSFTSVEQELAKALSPQGIAKAKRGEL